jgi:hypothetical protein
MNERSERGESREGKAGREQCRYLGDYGRREGK